MSSLPSPSSEPRLRLLPRVALPAVVLLGSVALDALTVRDLLRVESIEPPPAMLQPVTDARERAALRGSAAGRYRTGSEPGDRAIEIEPDGRIQFLRRLAGSDRTRGEDAYDVRRDGKSVFLVTRGSGVIEIRNIDTISYYQDVYHRERL